MDQFFTSLNKRQTMLLLTAITFGGQEGVAALEHLSQEQAELLGHRAQGIMQIPREKRIPLLVQELKRLVKDRRGQLWSADPERLAQLLRRERGALVEVVLRALPSGLADAMRAHVPQRPVKLTREVRPQILDIVRWKLEEGLARTAGPQASLKFTDVLLLQPRELLTVCDRLGARVLGPAMAGLPEAVREGLIAALPPDQKQLATKSIAANAPRKLPEEEAQEQLAVHDGLNNLSGAIRSAGVQRLARACVAQSAEFAARMLERHRGDFGSQLAKWVRDERSKPSSRTTDGGRADILADMERLAVRGLIERPVRLTPPRPVLNPPPGRAAPQAAPRPSAPPPPSSAAPSRRDPMAEREARRAGAVASNTGDDAVRRDPMAERAARRAGALSSAREPSRVVAPGTRDAAGVRREPGAAPPAPPREAERGVARSSAGASGPPRASSRVPSPRAGAPGVPRREVPPARVPPRATERASGSDPEGSRVISSPSIRSVSRTGMRAVASEEPERPPRVLSGKPSAAPRSAEGSPGEGRSLPRRPPSSPPPGNSGRGPRGGSR
ncbi:hypothetical protein [Stigmatella hybrida]|uniref:hypothetical protein n=1 Tax=Stigmatella hybrida TaxID=394097 RepID=UPI001CDAE659|nr:hypothetical protein [Stigmatella hybrida]